MDVGELTLPMIDEHRHLVTSGQVVSAVAYAVRKGYGDVTAYRFATALVMIDRLESYGQWPAVLQMLGNLKLTQDLNALNAGAVAPIDRALGED